MVAILDLMAARDMESLIESPAQLCNVTPPIRDAATPVDPVTATAEYSLMIFFVSSDFPVPLAPIRATFEPSAKRWRTCLASGSSLQMKQPG